MANNISSWPSLPPPRAEVNAAIAKRQYGTGLAVATDPAYGYVSGTDLGPAINAAIALMPAGTPSGGTVVIPPGDWTTSVTITLKTGIRIVGAGKNATRIVYANADSAGQMFTWSGTTNGVHLENIHLRSTSGHILRSTSGMHTWTIRNCHMYVSDPSASVLDHQSVGDYDKIVFEQCTLFRAGAATVPAVNILNSGGAANENAFRDCWFYSGGPGVAAATVPFLRMYNTSAANYCNDNVFENITGQQNIAGLLDLQSHANLKIENCVDWDINTLTGNPTTYTGSLVKVGKSTLGPASRQVMVMNSGVRGNSHGASTYDVDLVPGEVTDAVIINASKTSSGTKYNISTTASHNISVLNAAADNTWSGQPAGVRHRFSAMAQYLTGLWLGPDGGGTTSADGIQFGPDVNLFRLGANTLATQDAFRADGLIRASAQAGGVVEVGAVGSGSQAGIKLGGSQVWLAGAGAPEGVVTAPVGSWWFRTNPTSAADALYVKITGSGNTGWVAK